MQPADQKYIHDMFIDDDFNEQLDRALYQKKEPGFWARIFSFLTH